MRKVVLEDLLEDNLDIVFCGTAPGHASAAAGAYYAHKTNLFWPTLHAIGLTPHIFAAQDFPRLKALRIGLTDIAKFEHGSDDQLGRHALGRLAVKRLRERILAHQPKILAFTSKTGGEAVLGKGRHYGPQPETIGATKVWILPSTSFRARRAWDIAVWHALAREIHEEIRVAHGKIDVLAQSG